MKLPSQTKLFAGAALAIAVLLVNVALSLLYTRALHDEAALVAHTNEVIAGFENVLSLAKDAETGQRGFVITGEPRYLEPYNIAIVAIGPQVDALQGLTLDNPAQQARFPELRQSIDARLATLAKVITYRKTADYDVAQEYLLLDQGKRQMDSLRSLIAGMIGHERGLLRDRAQDYERVYRNALLTACLSGLLALSSIAAFLLLLRQFLAAREEASKIIAEQSERLRTTLASIGDGVIATDREGRITTMNTVAESLTGWKAADAIGKPLVTIFNIVNETTRKPVANPATRALSEGVIVGLANHTILIARDGAERPIDDSAAPIRCKDGEIVGCVLVFRDFTERRAEELRLAESERRQRFIMGAMPQKLFTAQTDGAVDFFNPVWSEYTGLSFERIRDWGWTQFIHPDDVDGTVRAWTASVASGEPFLFEHRFRRADGEYRWHISRARALKNETGEALMWVGSNTDVHEQKQTANALRDVAAQLSEADRRKNDFLAMLAHELRNPLAPISNALRIVQLSAGDGAAVLSASQIMERQVRQMVRLVDDLLDISRISHGKIELRREHVELASVIRQAVETSHPVIDAFHHQLTMDLPAAPIYVYADRVRLAQAFGNLLINAAKYSEPGGQITVTAEQRDYEVVISIKDQGIGISPGILPNIFDMFTQSETSIERSHGGLGIGLTLVRRLVELHQGSVSASSEGLGHGSEFVVRLPMTLRVPATPPSEPETIAPAPIVSSRRILVVDDNRDSAASMAMLMEINGNDTRTAYDGQEALQVAAEFRPDVVLLDLGLPELNGFEVARRIRGQPWGQNMTLIALTGWGQDEDRRKSGEAGFNGHLVKPVDFAALMKLMAELPGPN